MLCYGVSGGFCADSRQAFLATAKSWNLARTYHQVIYLARHLHSNQDYCSLGPSMQVPLLEPDRLLQHFCKTRRDDSALHVIHITLAATQPSVPITARNSI